MQICRCNNNKCHIHLTVIQCNAPVKCRIILAAVEPLYSRQHIKQISFYGAYPILILFSYQFILADFN